MQVTISNIILLMKRDKQIRITKNGSNSGLPAIENNAFNQTIIINNPNFNINYVDGPSYNPEPRPQNKTIYNNQINQAKDSSKGIEAWNLNKNLKQFSETRQLGFFKPNHTRRHQTKPSPYLSHKNKTAQIKPYSKVSPMPVHFRQNRTLSTVKKP